MEGRTQLANLANKTAAAAEEFKRLLAAEHSWAEERATLQAEVARQRAEAEKLGHKIRRLEEARAAEAASWRKEREAHVRDKEAGAARTTSLMRELDLKAQAEARFGMERKAWAERVERIEKIAQDAKEDARGAGEEVSRLQRAYQELFSKSRQEKEGLQRELNVQQEENTDARQQLLAAQEQHRAAASQLDALDRAMGEYRRSIAQLQQENEDLQSRISVLDNEVGDAAQQLAAAQQALEQEQEAHAQALEVERAERQRQQDFFAQTLAETEAEGRAAAAQAHALKLRVVQVDREMKRIKEQRDMLQGKVRHMDAEASKERAEWEATYEQLTEAIAAKEMEQDAAAAQLEVMLRSVSTGAAHATPRATPRGLHSSLPGALGGALSSAPPAWASGAHAPRAYEGGAEGDALRDEALGGGAGGGRGADNALQDQGGGGGMYAGEGGGGGAGRGGSAGDGEEGGRLGRTPRGAPGGVNDSGEEFPRALLDQAQTPYLDHGGGAPGSAGPGRSSSALREEELPSYMREMKRGAAPDSGATAGEIASFWNVGLRASGYSRDATRDATPPNSGSGPRRSGPRSWK